MMTLQEYMSATDANRKQAKWAEALGVSQAFLSQILNGTRVPGRKTMLKIEQATGGKVPCAVWFRSCEARGTGEQSNEQTRGSHLPAGDGNHQSA